MVAYTTCLLTCYTLGAMAGVSGCEKAHGKGWEVQGRPVPLLYTPSSPFVHPVGEIRRNILCLLVEKRGVLGRCPLIRVGIHVFLFV